MRTRSASVLPAAGLRLLVVTAATVLLAACGGGTGAGPGNGQGSQPSTSGGTTGGGPSSGGTGSGSSGPASGGTGSSGSGSTGSGSVGGGTTGGGTGGTGSGTACTSDADCPSGQACVASCPACDPGSPCPETPCEMTCQVPPSPGPAPAPTCSSDADCPKGDVCAGSCPTCKPGEPCPAIACFLTCQPAPNCGDSSCAAGEVCVTVTVGPVGPSRSGAVSHTCEAYPAQCSAAAACGCAGRALCPLGAEPATDCSGDVTQVTCSLP